MPDATDGINGLATTPAVSSTVCFRVGRTSGLLIPNEKALVGSHPHIVAPGTLIGRREGVLPGGGITVVGDCLHATLAGQVFQQDSSRRVDPGKQPYQAHQGDTIVGVVVATEAGRWKVDIGSQRPASLASSSFHWHGRENVQRGNLTPGDMRRVLREGDLICAEVQKSNVGVVSISTRSAKFGKLLCGVAVSLGWRDGRSLQAHWDVLSARDLDPAAHAADVRRRRDPVAEPKSSEASAGDAANAGERSPRGGSAGAASSVGLRDILQGAGASVSPPKVVLIVGRNGMAWVGAPALETGRHSLNYTQAVWLEHASVETRANIAAVAGAVSRVVARDGQVSKTTVLEELHDSGDFDPLV